MSDTAEDRRPLVLMANSIPVQDMAASTTGTTRAGHEAIIAQPSTFLLPRGYNRAMVEMPLSPLDKEQQAGLVSHLFRYPLPIPIPIPIPPFASNLR